MAFPPMARGNGCAVLALAVVAGSLLLSGSASANPPAGSRQLYGIAGSGSSASLVPFDVARRVRSPSATAMRSR